MNQNKTARKSKSGFSIRDALKRGWQAFKRYPGLLAGSILLVGFLSWGLSFSAQAVKSSSLIASWLLNLVSFVVQAGLTLGMVSLAFHVHRDQNPGISDLFTHFRDKRLLSQVGASILFGIMVSIGTLLFIIPGVYAALTFFLFPYAIVENNAGPIESLKYSQKLTSGVKWKLLGFLVIASFINILGLLLLGVGFLVTAPVVALATVALYEALVERSEAVTASTETENGEVSNEEKQTEDLKESQES